MCDWRCQKCGKLLGVQVGARLQIRIAGFQYIVGLPASCVCRECGTLNDLWGDAPLKEGTRMKARV